MRFKLLECAGFTSAVEGARLSFGVKNWDNFDDVDKSSLTTFCDKLANKDGGHNKFLESMQYWLLIDAPLYWWKQFDTYRIGVSKSSESTMHTIHKRHLTQEDFEVPVFDTTLKLLNEHIDLLKVVTGEEKVATFRTIVGNLPDSFLQTRMGNTNAKTLRNIFFQREHHKLEEWVKFCEFIKALPYGRYITAK